MYNEVIKLIKVTKTKDKYGGLVENETERTVFANIKSIGQSEFYQAQAVGFKPEVKFVLPDYLEYQDESKLKYKGINDAEEKTYSVIRTYRVDNTLELVCKKGVD